MFFGSKKDSWTYFGSQESTLTHILASKRKELTYVWIPTRALWLMFWRPRRHYGMQFCSKRHFEPCLGSQKGTSAGFGSQEETLTYFGSKEEAVTACVLAPNRTPHCLWQRKHISTALGECCSLCVFLSEINRVEKWKLCKIRGWKWIKYKAKPDEGRCIGWDDAEIQSLELITAYFKTHLCVRHQSSAHKSRIFPSFVVLLSL